MTGGRDNDRFYFDDGGTGSDAASADTIPDFARRHDVINLHAVDADTGAGAHGNQDFSFVGTAAFTGVAGELRYEGTASGILILGDTDGDGDADLAIALDGLNVIGAGDFVL